MSTQGAGPSNQQTLDPYRTLATAIQKPLAPYLPAGAAPTLPEALGISQATYAERLEGKTIILEGSNIPKSTSALVTGKKRNRGDSTAQKNVREGHEAQEKRRSDLGIVGLRKAKKRGGVVKKGQHIDSLIPLYHLHTAYLTSLFALTHLPQSPPSSSSSSFRSNAFASSSKLPMGLSQDGISVKLLKADFTGIKLSVESSRNASLIGLNGIAIEETSSTFRIVSPESKIKVVPKEGTQFGLSFPAYAPPKPAIGPDGLEEPIDWEAHLRVCPRIEVSLLGTNFGYRSGDRAGRKFKLAQGQGGSGWGEEWVKGEWDEVFPAVQVKRKKKGGQPKSSAAFDSSLQEKGIGAGGMRKRGKSRRKDPLAGGTREVVF